MNAYELITGTGTIYAAPVGTAFPVLGVAPAVAWVDMGYTQDGITVTYDEEVGEVEVDQETGAVKAFRTKESLTVETKLAIATLDNLGKLLGLTVTDGAADHAMGSYRGEAVQEYAFLFRGASAYKLAGQGQLEIPRGYFVGPIGLEFKKDANLGIPCTFKALVDLAANPVTEKFGNYSMQDTVA